LNPENVASAPARAFEHDSSRPPPRLESPDTSLHLRKGRLVAAERQRVEVPPRRRVAHSWRRRSAVAAAADLARHGALGLRVHVPRAPAHHLRAAARHPWDARTCCHAHPMRVTGASVRARSSSALPEPLALPGMSSEDGLPRCQSAARTSQHRLPSTPNAAGHAVCAC